MSSSWWLRWRQSRSGPRKILSAQNILAVGQTLVSSVGLNRELSWPMTVRKSERKHGVTNDGHWLCWQVDSSQLKHTGAEPIESAFDFDFTIKQQSPIRLGSVPFPIAPKSLVTAASQRKLTLDQAVMFAWLATNSLKLYNRHGEATVTLESKT